MAESNIKSSGHHKVCTIVRCSMFFKLIFRFFEMNEFFESMSGSSAPRKKSINDIMFVATSGLHHSANCRINLEIDVGKL